jgi:maltose O-acetyltransferase
MSKVRKFWGVVANTVVRSPLWTPSTRARLLRVTGATVGVKTRLYPFFTVINYVDEIALGDDVFINANVTFGSNAPIVIESGVSVGPGCSFLPTSHNVGSSNRRAGASIASPIRVGAGAWLGANVTVIGGVTIGRGSIVAAGAVVTEDVAADTIVAGVPARVIRALEESTSEPKSG